MEYKKIKKTSAGRGYSYQWQQARARYLKEHPLCVMCQKLGRVEAAHVVDHITPHRDDKKLFWDRSNWQALCDHCHSSHKQRLEKTGRQAGCDASGAPVDPLHPWNQ